MFRFRLEKVLHHRRRIVDTEARRLQVIGAEISRVRAQQHRFGQDITEIGMDTHHLRAGIVDIRRERAAGAFIYGRRRMIETLENEQQGLRCRFAQQRQVLIAAQRDVSVLEKLKESQYEAWRREERHRDQKMTDDVAGRTRSSRALN